MNFIVEWYVLSVELVHSVVNLIGSLNANNSNFLWNTSVYVFL
jgi:hypothetical protein